MLTKTHSPQLVQTPILVFVSLLWYIPASLKLVMGVVQEKDNTSRRVRAGRLDVLTYEEDRERMKGTRLGEILGLNGPNPT